MLRCMTTYATDTERWAAKLDEAEAKLQGALDELHRERRLLQEALIRKAEATLSNTPRQQAAKKRNRRAELRRGFNGREGEDE